MPQKRPEWGVRNPFIDAFMHGSILFGYAAAVGIGDVFLFVSACYLTAIFTVHFFRLHVRPPFVSERFALWSLVCALLFTLSAAIKPAWRTSAGVSLCANGVILVGFLVFVSALRLKQRFLIVTTLAIMLFFLSALAVRPPEFLPLFAAMTISTSLLSFAVAVTGAPRRERITAAPVAIAHTLAIVAAAIVVFIALPRFDRGATPQPRPAMPEETHRDDRGATGVTEEGTAATAVGLPPRIDSVSIRNFRKLLDSRAIAARVSFAGENLERALHVPVYLRAVTYDTYADGAWSAPAARRRIDDAADGSEDGAVVLRRFLPDHERLVHQRIVPTPTLGRVILSTPDPVRFHVPSVMSDDAGLFLFPPMTDAGLPYETDALPPVFPADKVENITRSAASPRSLRVPDGLDEIRTIALRVTEGRTTVMEKIRALQAYLAETCQYDLSAVNETDVDPVREFLTVRRTGYCVHFASTMTVMLRQIGIPALVAGGFLCRERSGGDWEFIVRDGDAHMWSEVYFDEMGWMIVEATPPDAIAARPQPMPDEPVEVRRTPVVEERDGWSDPLSEFSAKTRDAIFEMFGSVIRDVLPEIGNALQTCWPFAVSALIVALIIYVILPRTAKSRMIAAIQKVPMYSAIPFYNDFLWILYRRGIVRSPIQTPREFARSLPATIPADAVAIIASAYERVTYGRASLSIAEMEKIRASLRRIVEKA